MKTLQEKIEIAAKVRVELEMNSSIEDAFPVVSSFPESQLDEIVASYEENMEYRNFAKELFNKYVGSGKTTIQVVKENLEDVKQRFGNYIIFLKQGIDMNGFTRDQVL